MDDVRARILIIDDDEHVLITLERLLESAGYCTATAWSGKQALDILQKSEFDLLLVDEHLPDLNVINLVKDLEHAQHRAYRLLMRPFPVQSQGAEGILPSAIHGSVCKWEHSAITAKIQNYLPADRVERQFQRSLSTSA